MPSHGNPIEEAFSKLKALLRQAGARTSEALIEAMDWVLEALTEGRSRLLRTPRLPRYGPIAMTDALEAAGEGFEPSLTDPESLSIRSRLLLSVFRTAYLRRFSVRGVARCSPVFLMGWCTNWCSRKMQDSAEMICWTRPILPQGVSSADLGKCSNTLPDQVSTLLDVPKEYRTHAQCQPIPRNLDQTFLVNTAPVGKQAEL
jgi:hypothetical protein